MTENLQTLEGWYTLHDFRSFDWPRWRLLSKPEQQEIQEEFFSVLKQYQFCNDQRTGAFACYEILGHKSDFLFLNLRENMHELAKAERALQKTAFSEFAPVLYSYVSVVELSNYVHGNGEKTPEVQAMIDARLKPDLPKTNHICFYPMNKKREGKDNWYTESMDERRRMMKEHGLIGRKYAGKVTQMIGGSIGLDDWEWGVTLFAEDPLVFKHLVSEMRFDEVSARFAEFGAFYVGNRLEIDSMVSSLQ
ncbi:MAG: heme-dependent peroxidase [Deltaproteobacteria bacterium]|nr:heme-dependent peroxidase [Deltaproteobacteria bacterium]